MKVIIISDKDCVALLDQLELKSLKANNIMPEKPMSVGDIHRAFHYVVVQWLQAQGADLRR